MGKNSPPWEVYKEELHSKGYGLPMWFPEPMQGREVQIGDVGMLKDGKLTTMFNAHTGTKYGQWSLPEGFEKFEIFPELKSSSERFIPAGLTVFSTGVSTKQAAAEATGGGVGGARFDFQVTRERGAILFARDDAKQEQVMPHKRMMDYMAKHIDNWTGLVNQHTGDTKQEDFVFVRGAIKSKAWGVASLVLGHSRQAVQISGQYAGAGAGVQVVHDKMHSASLDQRWSPADEIREKADQCLFLNYYRYRRRIFWRMVLEAGAGPHELPEGEDEAGEGEAEGVVVPDSEVEADNDPVNHLLDYIFRHSDAEAAIACDGDITELTHGGEWPENLAEYLVERMPEIATINGVGMIAQDKAVYRAHFNAPDEEEEEEEVVDFPEVDNEANNDTSNVAGPSGTSHIDADADAVAQPEASGSEQQMDVAEDHGVFGTGLDIDAAIAADEELLPESDTMDQDDGRPEKTNPSESSSVLGKITVGDTTLDWPHRQLLDPEEGAEIAAIGSIHISADGEYIGVGYEDGQMRVWNSRKWRLVLRMLDHHAESVSALKFSPDSKRLASAARQGFVWDVEDGRDGHYHEICQLAGLGDQSGELVWDLDWSPDSKTVATGSSDFKVRLFNAANGNCTRVLDDPRSLVSLVRYTKDGMHLVCASDNSGYIWNAYSGELLGMMDGHAANIWCMNFSPDSMRIITGSEDATHRIWNVENGEELVTLREHTGPIWAVEFAQDGLTVMAGSYDKTTSICDSYVGTRRHLLQGRQSTVTAGAYAPSGRYIATGSSDGSVKLWDAKKGVLLADLFGHEDHIKTLLFSPKDDHFVTCSDDGTVRVWSVKDILRVC